MFDTFLSFHHLPSHELMDHLSPYSLTPFNLPIHDYKAHRDRILRNVRLISVGEIEWNAFSPFSSDWQRAIEKHIPMNADLFFGPTDLKTSHIWVFSWALPHPQVMFDTCSDTETIFSSLSAFFVSNIDFERFLFSAAFSARLNEFSFASGRWGKKSIGGKQEDRERWMEFNKFDASIHNSQATFMSNLIKVRKSKDFCSACDSLNAILSARATGGGEKWRKWKGIC